MQDPTRTITALSTTAGTGAAGILTTLTYVQLGVGVVASAIGIVATVLVTWWQYKLYKRRIKTVGEE